MSDREKERWLNQQEPLRYCVIHKRYYDVNVGCQLCWLENHKNAESPPLEKCPKCNETSLFHNTVANTYECVNMKCMHKFTKKELDELNCSGECPAQPQIEQPSTPAETLLKCPVCLFNKLKWIPERNIYECQYDKCHGRTFSKEELEEIYRIREAPTKGKSWFGNEYWDPKKKRWRKP